MFLKLKLQFLQLLKLHWVFFVTKLNYNNIYNIRQVFRPSTFFVHEEIINLFWGCAWQYFISGYCKQLKASSLDFDHSKSSDAYTAQGFIACFQLFNCIAQTRNACHMVGCITEIYLLSCIDSPSLFHSISKTF